MTILNEGETRKKVVYGMLSSDINKWKSSYILYEMKSFSIW